MIFGTKDNYISLTEAANLCDYSQEYLSLRARQGKLQATKLGRNWVTTPAWLYRYLQSVEEARIQQREVVVVAEPVLNAKAPAASSVATVELSPNNQSTSSNSLSNSTDPEFVFHPVAKGRLSDRNFFTKESDEKIEMTESYPTGNQFNWSFTASAPESSGQNDFLFDNTESEKLQLTPSSNQESFAYIDLGQFPSDDRPMMKKILGLEADQAFEDGTSANQALVSVAEEEGFWQSFNEQTKETFQALQTVIRPVAMVSVSFLFIIGVVFLDAPLQLRSTFGLGLQSIAESLHTNSVPAAQAVVAQDQSLPSLAESLIGVSADSDSDYQQQADTVAEEDDLASSSEAVAVPAEVDNEVALTNQELAQLPAVAQPRVAGASIELDDPIVLPPSSEKESTWQFIKSTFTLGWLTLIGK